MKGIKIAMTVKGITTEAVAEFLHIHSNSAANKIKGKTPFMVEEALKLQEGLFPEYTLDYLFKDVISCQSER